MQTTATLDDSWGQDRLAVAAQLGFDAHDLDSAFDQWSDYGSGPWPRLLEAFEKAGV